MDRSDANFAARETLLAKNQQIMRNYSTMDEKYLIKYVQMIRNTYRAGQVYQYRMSIPLATMAGFYRMRGDLKRTAETFTLMFKLLKDCDSIFSGMIIMQAINSYLECSMIKEAKECLALAKEYFVGPVEYYNYVYAVNNFTLR